MHENLQQLYQRTEGFRKTPQELSPSGLENMGRALLGGRTRNVARGDLSHGAFFEVYQSAGNPDVWMNIYRADGSLAESQRYYPTAAVAALVTTQFDASGKTPLHCAVTAPDGRLIEEIVLNDRQYERMFHIYPDVHDGLAHEIQKYGPRIQCHYSIDRFYQDRDGRFMTMDRHFSQGNFIREVHYHDDGKHIKTVQENQPGNNKPAIIRSYTGEGRLTGEQTFDNHGRTTHYTEYDTESVDDPPKKKREQVYRHGGLEAEYYYHKGSDQISVLYTFDRETHKRKSRTAYTRVGRKYSEQSYDAEERTTSYQEYYTDDIEDVNKPPVKIKQTFKDGILQAEFGYHMDGTLRFRKDCEEDGKHVRLYQGYNATGEYPVDIRKFKDGKIVKQVLMERAGDMTEVKRIFLYDEEGNPYRSREHYNWEGDRFWGETELDRETGHPLCSLVPAPTGLIRHTYDLKSGRVRLTETFSEPELGDVRRQATHYHPAPPNASHPEQQVSLVPSRVEFFEEDGETPNRINTFRADRSNKFREWRDNEGKWIRRAYAPGTKQANDDTPFIFENVTGPEGKRERSILLAHSDPAIVALRKEYDADGKPEVIAIEMLDGKEEVYTWQEYKEKKIKERQQQPHVGPVTLATIAPQPSTAHPGEESYNGRMVMTFQGDVAALKKTQSQLMHRFADIKCELCIGDKQMVQYRGQTGRYAAPNNTSAALEKVDVLKVVIPYKKRDADRWPKSFPPVSADSEDLRACRTRAQEEATDLLRNVYRYTNCDLRLKIKPVLLRHKTTDKPVYEASVSIGGPEGAYLSPVQAAAIRQVVAEQLSKAKFTYRNDRDQIYIDTGKTTFIRESAEDNAIVARKHIADRLVPKPLQPPGNQK